MQDCKEQGIAPLSFIIERFLSNYLFLSNWRETKHKDPYLAAKDHPTLDVITIPSFYTENLISKDQILDEICTLVVFYIWI